MKKFILFIFYLIHKTTAIGVIYSLNDEEYSRMPSKYHLDRFQACLARPGGQYCTVWADLVADQPSDLLDMIQAYSAHYTNHFNYSNIKYGLCLTRSCRQFYDGNSSRAALWSASEACLNHSLSREYELKARVTDVDCYRHGHAFAADALDAAVALLLAALLVLNAAGTVYDTCRRDRAKPGSQFLVSFSLVANWRRMVAPPSQNPMHQRLSCWNGIRAITSILVVVGHLQFVTVNRAVNPNSFEELYSNILGHLALQGHLVIVTFYTMAGFLLAYSYAKQAEMGVRGLSTLPWITYYRWLRLTPPNLVVLMLTAVWYKYITVGPLFKEAVMGEASDCRKYWLYNVFYVTNMIDHSQCNLQVWYLSSDMQLHIIALAVLLAAPAGRARSWALAALLLVGVAGPAWLVYAHDLDGTLLATPTTYNEYFARNIVFNSIFKTTIGNMPAFIIGMYFGFLLYHMEKKDLLNCNYRKYRLAYWALLVVVASLKMAGYVFFRDGPRAPLWLRMLFMPVVKPLYAVSINLFVLGTICRCEDLIRGLMEWKGWLPISRVSYCMYLVHMMVVRYTAGSAEGLFYISPFHQLQYLWGVVAMTLIYAALLHLLVEAPFAAITDRYFKAARAQLQPAPKAD